MTERYRVYFQDEVRGVPCGWRGVTLIKKGWKRVTIVIIGEARAKRVSTKVWKRMLKRPA